MIELHTGIDNVELEAQETFDEGGLAVGLHANHDEFGGLEADVETNARVLLIWTIVIVHSSWTYSAEMPCKSLNKA